MPSALEVFVMVPVGLGTCAAIDESQTDTSAACALPPGGIERGLGSGLIVAQGELGSGERGLGSGLVVAKGGLVVAW